MSICLRRSKQILPMYQSTNNWARIIHEIEFNSQEQAEYSRLATKCRESLLLAINGHKTKKTHRTILEQLLRLRMFCNNGTRETPSSDKGSDDILSCLQQDGEATCFYCSCDITSLGHSGDTNSAISTSCRHLVCSECIGIYKSAISSKTAHAQRLCPICLEQHDEDELMIDVSNISDPSSSSPQPTYPSKLLKLLGDIKEHISYEKRHVTYRRCPPHKYANSNSAWCSVSGNELWT